MSATIAAHEGHARPVRRASPLAIGVWFAVLVVGFALVFTLGAPLPSSVQQRADARAPLPTPVTETAAVVAAEELVRLDYPEYADATRSVRPGTTRGEEIWIVTFSRRDPVSGVRITISGRTGEISATVFP